VTASRISRSCNISRDTAPETKDSVRALEFERPRSRASAADGSSNAASASSGSYSRSDGNRQKRGHLDTSKRVHPNLELSAPNPPLGTVYSSGWRDGSFTRDACEDVIARGKETDKRNECDISDKRISGRSERQRGNTH